jgi:DNA-binding MarR family transcriptional regulator
MLKIIDRRKLERSLVRPTNLQDGPENVGTKKPEDIEILERLQVLGVALLREWDVLAFLYRHPSSLCSPAEIARFVGCDGAEVGAALRKLEGLGILERSRISRGIRLYRFSMPAEAGLRSCLIELMGLTQDCAGRLLLLKHLSTPEEPRQRRVAGLHLT